MAIVHEYRFDSTGDLWQWVAFDEEGLLASRDNALNAHYWNFNRFLRSHSDLKIKRHYNYQRPDLQVRITWGSLSWSVSLLKSSMEINGD